ncbi:MAG: efflux RND transporter periplasmic adaptor subunit [Kiritimatiellae bacterium]|nr:efflux RND transporter periplasmic adaptor subunit [Kiritimatiellia bacterium]
MNNVTGEHVRRHIVWPLLLLLAAGGGAVWMVKTRPTAEHRTPPEMVALVSILEARPATETIRVAAMGTVEPAERVELQAEVAGRVVAQHPRLVPGGRVRAGETLVKLEAADYEYALDQQKAALDKAVFDLKVERGRKKIAEEEWRRLDLDVKVDDEARALALREPHLKAAESALEAAKSALSKARLNLDRTAVRAPFTAVVVEEYTDVGQFVPAAGRVATLVGVERARVRASVPVEWLRWIPMPDDLGRGGAAARVSQDLGTGSPAARNGQVIRLLPDLDPAGRMARLLVQVERPFDEDAGPPLLIGSYVRAEIEGRPVEDVYRLPRAAIRDGAQVWVMNAEDRLEVRPVEVVWTQETESFVRGLQPGDRIVVSPLALPMPGMKLRVEGEPAEKPEEKPEGASPGEPATP